MRTLFSYLGLSIASAEHIRRRIVETYLAPNQEFSELRDMIADGSTSPLRAFSEACRAELDGIRAGQA